MRKTSLRSIALALCVALQLAISALSGPALAAISLPSGCTITASPESSATNVLVAGTQVNLTGSCASGDGPIRFIWSAGGGETIRPTTTASYAAVPFNDAGSGIPAFVTVYTGVSGALSAPSGCSITQTPDTRFKPPAPGSTISLRAFCVEGGAATACNWSDPTLGSSCRVSVVAIDQSTSVSATPFNAAGSAAPITTQITGSSNVINSSSEVVIVRANAMVNGSPLKEPQFVGAGDVITFDTVLQSMPLGTGLGLCLEFSRSFGVVKLHNIYSDGYVGGGTAAQYLERYFCDRRSITVPGADSTIIVPWAHFTGYWPDVPTPLKLYDVEVTVGLNVRAASYVGFGASALPSLATLRVEQPLLLCPKSTVVVSQAAVSASQVAFNLLLSAAVSGACGVNGTLPVVLEVVTPSARAIGVTGSGVSLNGQSLTVPVPADGRTTAVPFTVSFSQPIDPAFTAKIVQLIATGGNYDDGGTSIAAPVVPLVPGNVGFGIGGGGIINFSPGAPGIAVSKSGRGDGKVTSSVGNIQCPPDCTAYYGSGTSVTLTADRKSVV